jgi:hypothetical protein
MKKKIILIIAFITISSTFSSCDSLFYPSQKNYEKVYTEMTVKDFLKEHSKAKNEYLSQEMTIYSIRFMDPMDSRPYRKFYYFENNKLVRVDKGEKAVDYRIRID